MGVLFLFYNPPSLGGVVVREDPRRLCRYMWWPGVTEIFFFDLFSLIQHIELGFRYIHLMDSTRVLTDIPWSSRIINQILADFS